MMGEHVGRHYDISLFTCAGYEGVIVRAGRCRTERIVPPAGEDHAFDREVWDHRVEVSVSPTGRSVQVFVDGERFTKQSVGSTALPSVKSAQRTSGRAAGVVAGPAAPTNHGGAK